MGLSKISMQLPIEEPQIAASSRLGKLKFHPIMASRGLNVTLLAALCLLFLTKGSHYSAIAIGTLVVFIIAAFLTRSKKPFTTDVPGDNDKIASNVLDTLAQGVIAIDKDGRLLFVNKALRSLYCVDNSLVRSEQWKDLFTFYTSDYSCELSGDNHPLTRALRGDHVEDLEVLVVGTNRQAHYCQVSSRPIVDANGDRYGALIVLHDASERRRTEQEVNRLASIVECSTDAVVGTNLDGTVVSWNAAAARLYEIKASEAIGRPAATIVDFSEISSIPDVAKLLLDGVEVEPVEVCLRKKDGTSAIVSLRYSPIQDAGGTVIGVSATASDVSYRKRAEAALYESQRQLAEAQRVAQMGSFEVDLASEEVAWSRQMYRLYDFDPIDGTPTIESIRRRHHPDDLAAMAEAQAKAIQTTRKYKIDVRILLPDSGIRHCQIVGQPVTDENGKVVRILGTAMDITERKQAEQIAQEATTELQVQKKALEEANSMLESLATSDSLTGLRNRRALDTQIEQEFARSKRYRVNLSFILLDIDYFKAYNDSFGHQAGDDVLRNVAEVLKKGTRESDVVARYGGEELCVVLPETAVAEAETIAERLRVAIANADWEFRQVTVSLGVSTYLPGMIGADDLILGADKALYISKESGRNRVTLAEHPAQNLQAA
jgi:diguanylate cyclase (GGDEF)-like protein/PAS domain S-box-containing protein